MDNYLIAVDLDDTLLTAEKSITTKTKAYIRKKQKKVIVSSSTPGGPFRARSAI